MSIVQENYVENLSPAVNGQRATSATMESDSYIAQVELQFGRAVRLGTTPDRVRAGVGFSDFVGVTLKDSTRDPSDENAYDEGAHAAVVYRGDMWVAAEAAVVAGTNVTADSTSGRLSSAPSSAVLRIELTSGGTGYTADPTVTVTGGGGSGATFTVTRDDGVITGVTVTDGGSGFTSVPTVVFTNAASDTAGAGAAGRAVLDRATIAGARWMTTAAADGLAVLRLGTDLPAV